jgi:GntR family transcriptional regulator
VVTEDRPLFLQIVEQLESAIVDGSLPEGAQVPSTNELAAFHRINPATALKGVTRLVADGVLHKRRGIGMFVSTGARELLLQRRHAAFSETFVRPLVEEARRIGIAPEELHALLDDVAVQA